MYTVLSVVLRHSRQGSFVIFKESNSTNFQSFVIIKWIDIMWRNLKMTSVWHMSLTNTSSYSCWCLCHCYCSDGPCDLIKSNRAKGRKKWGHIIISQSKDRKIKNLCFFYLYLYHSIKGKSLYTHIEKPSLWVCMEILGCMTTKYFKILCKCNITNYHSKYCETSQDNYFSWTLCNQS